MNSAPMQLYDPDEAARQLADRLRAERLRQDLTQGTLAKRSGVSLPTVQRYERTGQTTVENLLKLCHALGRLDEFAELLAPPPASSLSELEGRAEKPKRKRGSR